MNENSKFEISVLTVSPNVEDYVNLSWNILHSTLYYSCIFSSREVDTTRTLIKRFLLQFINPYEGYIEFAQKVIIAKKKIGNEKLLCLIPSVWMNENYPYGIVNVHEEYQQLIQLRKQLPLYLIELRAFAEAVLEVSENPNGEIFNYWKQWFSERNFIEEMYLFGDVVLFNLLKL